MLTIGKLVNSYTKSGYPSARLPFSKGSEAKEWGMQMVTQSELIEKFKILNKACAYGASLTISVGTSITLEWGDIVGRIMPNGAITVEVEAISIVGKFTAKLAIKEDDYAAPAAFIDYCMSQVKR